MNTLQIQIVAAVQRQVVVRFDYTLELYLFALHGTKVSKEDIYDAVGSLLRENKLKMLTVTSLTSVRLLVMPDAFIQIEKLPKAGEKDAGMVKESNRDT